MYKMQVMSISKREISKKQYQNEPCCTKNFTKDRVCYQRKGMLPGYCIRINVKYIWMTLHTYIFMCLTQSFPIYK